MSDDLAAPSVNRWVRRQLTGALASIGYSEAGELRDYTTSTRVILITGIAIGIGVVSAYVALALLRLIGLFTNLFFFQRWNTTLSSPADADVGIFILLIPVIGGIIVGIMARYGSDKIRGHGIPEAIESILMNGSRVEPKVAILKPVSSAIAIGSGGPFGAEGPIIMTGGAFGSIVAQFIHLSAAERKTLLVAGAAGGMSAVFNTPFAAVLLAVELLLFEWKPRSLIPVAASSATAAVLRHYLIGGGALFPVPPHPEFIGPWGLLCCVFVGITAGALSVIVTNAVYLSEDGFGHLPIHWMWWPAIGGLVIGIGGLIFPEALGVGYSSVGEMLSGDATTHLLVGMLLVKSTIWALSLGSGTSGGVVAPLLLMGGALGGLESGFLPNEGAGFWALIAMAAVLGGTMRAPLMATVFALELTHDINALLPLMVGVVVAFGFTVLAMRRSILTEKISRRGYHLAAEYAIDPLEIILVKEVMRTNVTALPATAHIAELAASIGPHGGQADQRLYPVLGDGEKLEGVISRSRLLAAFNDESLPPGTTVRDLVDGAPVVARPGEPLRAVVYRMADTGLTRLPVVDPHDATKLAGMVALGDLLKARTRTLDAERRRERVLRTRMLVPGRRSRIEV